MNSPVVIRTAPLDFTWTTPDPFLFCVYHQDFFPKGNQQLGPDQSLEGRNIGQDFVVKDGWRMYHGDRIPGFPSHPHRGFETITVVRKGLIDHSDSLGASGRYSEGDTQWMTAGKGVQHSEMFPLLHQDKDNPMELFQIWLNLPAKNKMSEPHFSMFWNEDTPVLNKLDDQGNTTQITLIAGQLDTAKALAPPPDSWANPAENKVAIWIIKMQPNAEWTIPAEVEGVNRHLYFYSGSNVSIAGQNLDVMNSAELRPEIDAMLKNGDQKAMFLFLQGKPIGEPVEQHGPFVMNTREELQQAFYDYQKTQFGGWPWPDNDQVHGKEKGRFAKHADGKLETP